MIKIKGSEMLREAGSGSSAPIMMCSTVKKLQAFLLGRLPKVNLIILEGENVRPSVRTSVRPSTKSFFDLNEIWYVGRGR